MRTYVVAYRPVEHSLTSAVLVIGSANRRFYEHYGVPRVRQFFTPYSVDNQYFLAQRELIEPLRPHNRGARGWTDDVAVIGFSGKLIPLPDGIQFLAPAREDARLYRVGAALEAVLVDSWGGPLLDRAPALNGGAR